MKKLLNLLLICPTFLFAQSISSTKQWDRTLGGTGYEVLYSLQQTSDGGYILGGASDSGINSDKTEIGRGAMDFWLIKLQANGTKLWDKTFGGSNSEYLMSVSQTTDGGYILGGFSSSGIGGDKTQANKGANDIWVIKVSSNGTKLWDKTFGGNSEDHLYTIRQTSDGGFILGGTSSSSQNGDKSQVSQGMRDYWILKIDASGNKLWDKTYGGSGDEDLYCLQLTSDGGYVLGGFSSSGLTGDKSEAAKGLQDYWVVKVDASGTKQWDKTFGGANDDLLSWVQQTNDGGYILGGYSKSLQGGDKSQMNQGLSDYWIIKLNSSGVKLWDKTFGGSSSDNLFMVQQTTDGGYLLGGNSSSGAAGDKTNASLGQTDNWLVKTDAAGTKIWDITVGGTGTEDLYALQQTADGGFLIGSSSSSGISADKSQPAQGSKDFWVYKTGASPTGIPENNIAGYSLSQNAPNPFNQHTSISFTIPKPETVDFTIYNSLGKTVAKLQKKYNTGANSINWQELEETKNLSAGTYFYQLNAGNFSATKQMILLKQ